MYILEFLAKSGETVRFQATATAGPVSRGGVGDLVMKSTVTLESAIDSIRPAVAAVANSLKQLSNPDEIEVEFGFKLTAEAGALITTAGAETHFNVTLKWQKQPA